MSLKQGDPMIFDSPEESQDQLRKEWKTMSPEERVTIFLKLRRRRHPVENDESLKKADVSINRNH
jgi:predicted Fe-S protein YdhL (DUF1289 family)